METKNQMLKPTAVKALMKMPPDALQLLYPWTVSVPALVSAKEFSDADLHTNFSFYKAKFCQPSVFRFVSETGCMLRSYRYIETTFVIRRKGGGVWSWHHTGRYAGAGGGSGMAFIC